VAHAGKKTSREDHSSGAQSRQARRPVNYIALLEGVGICSVTLPLLAYCVVSLPLRQQLGPYLLRPYSTLHLQCRALASAKEPEDSPWLPPPIRPPALVKL
jgi:hypothetical protein